MVINYANRSDQAAEVVQNIQRNGGDATAMQADISRPSDLERLYQGTLDTFGKLDIVVNNRQLAKELGKSNITINAVAPGPINTELFTVGKSPEWVTGQTIRVNGGFI